MNEIDTYEIPARIRVEPQEMKKEQLEIIKELPKEIEEEKIDSEFAEFSEFFDMNEAKEFLRDLVNEEQSEGIIIKNNKNKK